MNNKRELIEGKPALVVIDIQAGSFTEIDNKDRSIPHMPDYAERMRLARKAIDRARACDIPVIFIQEVHRPNLVDFGRELDGSETIHCLEDNPNTAIAVEEMDFRPDDYLIRKRRYSAFFGTDLEILLQDMVFNRHQHSFGRASNIRRCILVKTDKDHPLFSGFGIIIL